MEAFEPVKVKFLEIKVFPPYSYTAKSVIKARTSPCMDTEIKMRCRI